MQGPDGGPKYQGPDYRHMLVNSTADVRFYHYNPEHSTANANAEFRASKRISVFGTKSEGSSATIWVRDCEDVLHTGHAGNAAPIACAPEDPLRGCDWTAGPPSLFRVEGCRGNCRFGNLWTCAPARARLRPATPANCAAHLCAVRRPSPRTRCGCPRARTLSRRPRMSGRR